MTDTRHRFDKVLSLVAGVILPVTAFLGAMTWLEWTKPKGEKQPAERSK